MHLLARRMWQPKLQSWHCCGQEAAGLSMAWPRRCSTPSSPQLLRYGYSALSYCPHTRCQIWSLCPASSRSVVRCGHTCFILSARASFVLLLSQHSMCCLLTVQMLHASIHLPWHHSQSAHNLHCCALGLSIHFLLGLSIHIMLGLSIHICLGSLSTFAWTLYPHHAWTLYPHLAWTIFHIMLGLSSTSSTEWQ